MKEVGLDGSHISLLSWLWLFRCRRNDDDYLLKYHDARAGVE
jgi:hypothetical protein